MCACFLKLCFSVVVICIVLCVMRYYVVRLGKFRKRERLNLIPKPKRAHTLTHMHVCAKVWCG